jgi:hypothetical protein
MKPVLVTTEHSGEDAVLGYMMGAQKCLHDLAGIKCS